MNDLDSMLFLAGWMVVGLLPLAALSYGVYYLFSLPLRRQEQARLLLDLVETGLSHGSTIEHTILSASQTRDRSLGRRFHQMAGILERGSRLSAAMDQVPGLVPCPMQAMLKVGEEIGDVKRILPACRALLKDSSAQIQSSHNYLVVLAFVAIPVIPALFWMLQLIVAPKLKQIFADLTEDMGLPALQLFDGALLVAQIQLALTLLFYAGAVFYAGGPRLVSWLGSKVPMGWLEWLCYATPWRRKRMQRDFSAMLGVLLDAGVAEPRAIELAATSTANPIFIRRARDVIAELRRGVRLGEAMQKLDDTGEFRWRLANALKSGKNFFLALTGWLEALDAKAFQQQQATAQTVTTAIVLFNGVMAALVAVSVFRALTAIIEAGVLW